ncbi:MAG: helix-turn-helix transcriptional regulator [Bacteroidetes bacterium]|nr:helix-turn-helix transcriptional regulator [Bacteroidota bacterium]
MSDHTHNESGADAVSVKRLGTLMQALADINRLRILNLLLNERELCVCDIEHVLAVPQARVSRHLNILRNGGWVAARREGRWMQYRLTADTALQKDLSRSFRKRWSNVPEFSADLQRLRLPVVACNAKDRSERT